LPKSSCRLFPIASVYLQLSYTSRGRL
jgi:hypothetical protein